MLNRNLSDRRRLGIRTAAVITVLLFVCTVPGADDRNTCSVQLVSGGTFEATFAASEQPGIVRLHNSHFERPFEFSVHSLSTVRFLERPHEKRENGPFCVELAGGTVLFGNITGLTNNKLTLETEVLGRQTIDREYIQRISRGSGTESVIYIGPNGSQGWRMNPPDRLWKEDGGVLSSDVPGSRISADVRLPEKCKIELELSWRLKADFVLGMAIHPDFNFHPFDFRLETWGRELILYRETEKLADLASIQEIGEGAGRVRLVLFLDQTAGRLIAFDAFGKKLAEIKASPERPEVLPGVRLVNKRGDISLERLRVSRWSGIDLQFVDQQHIAVQQKDRNAIKGKLGVLDSESRLLSILGDDGELRLPLDDLADVSFSGAKTPAPAEFSAACIDGSRLAGNLDHVANETIFVKNGGIREPLAIPLNRIRSLLFNRSSDSKPPAEIAGDQVTGKTIGRLEMKNVAMRGVLANSDSQPDSSCLNWQPVGALQGSRIRQGMSGRIVYVEPPAPAPTATPSIVRPTVSPTPRPTPKSAGVTRQQRQIHLRTGDVIRCESIRADASGVAIESLEVKPQSIPHSEIKLAELGFGLPAPSLTRIQRDRLLTVPRLLKDNPPTHLIQSITGDFLRGRLLSLDQQTLIFEVRLERIEIPINRISRIWWLHASEIEEVFDSPAVADSVETGGEQRFGAMRIQAIRPDGTRLTLWGDHCDSDTIIGQSDVIGECRFEIGKINEILFGAEINRNVAQLAAQQWRLRGATEPISVRAGDGTENSERKPGVELPLVGQPAPAFRLPRWDSGSIELSSLKGQVVILDFWASWCGPCMKAMPELEQLAKEFKESGVQLVAINLEEPPDTIATTVHRYHFEMPIAMDREGIVGQKYMVTSLPQTVIVDRQGKVARIYVGANRQFEQIVRTALEELTVRE